MEQPFSTSKVTIEYFDPHGVYKLVAPGLIPRLPLRHLHWQSHAGPLRSIDTLHIELAPEGSIDPRPIFSPDPFFPSLQRSDSSSRGKDSGDGFQTQIGSIGGTVGTDASNQTAGHRSSTPARRHQIPGLRRTPYLKILLVRCDDNDTYKGGIRQEIRDWIKAQTPSTGSTKKANTAENHDAFEWLILHVVVPNTAAAAQPRVTGKSEATEKQSAASRWRPGSSTLFEKLRSDFNSTSKGAIDRIAQIRIGVNDVPYDILPRVVPAVPSSYKETAEESESAWNDLVSKTRDLILSSFDMRVSQYEEDIKEKDVQRSLPGWNFCTFFILKEGLARGFESVGLVEDALVGYDELSVGLDMVIKDLASGKSAAANTLLTYTEELKDVATKAVAAATGAAGEEDEVVDLQASKAAAVDSTAKFDEIPISFTKKPYRDLILENKVSVFDFRCYIFARQIALLQRLGNVWSTREELLAKLKEQQESIIHGVAPTTLPPKQTENDQEDLSMLAEICRRTLEFIPSVSQVMRNDVHAALSLGKATTQNELDSTLSPAALEVLDNVVASFAFSIAQQILAQTSTKALPIPPSSMGPSDGQEPKSTIPEPKTIMHPARSSSLRVSTGTTGVPPPPSPNVFPGPGQGSAIAEHQTAKNHVFLKVGLEELAARRAELYALSRNILEECGKKRGWDDGWSAVPVVGESSMVDMVEISLEDEATSDTVTKKHPIEAVISTAGVDSKLLHTALGHRDDFYRLYELLTDKALRHYTVANHTHSVQACMADLAVFKYYLGEYNDAAYYFYQTTPFFGANGWTLLELSMLVMYSRCLKRLEKKEVFVNVMLKLLSMASAAERDRQKQRTSFRLGQKKSIDFPDHDAIKGFLADLLSETKLLPTAIRVLLTNFFGAAEVDGTPEYHDGRDSFSIRLTLTSLLVDGLEVDEARMRIIAQVAGTSREIWLESPKPVHIKTGKNTLQLDSSVIVPGTYEVDRIELVASNLCLHYERDLSSYIKTSAEFLRAPRITIFNRPEALNVSLNASDHIQLDKNNTVDIDLETGWNELTNAEVRVKAATGGLRLVTAEATCVTSAAHDPSFSKPPEAGLFCFDWVPPKTSIKIRFPYTVETEVSEISIKIEVSYKTEHGSYLCSRTPSLPISLPLGVNVQDIFKHKTLLSKFTVSTANISPLNLYKSELVGSDIFESEFGYSPSNVVTIFPRQPASLLYKITRKKGVAINAKTLKTMYLKLDYRIIQDDIISVIRDSITGTLRDSPLHLYSRFIVDTILPHIENDLGPLELERAALFGYIQTAFLAGINWTSHFVGLGRDKEGIDVTTTLTSFLTSWTSRNRTLKLPTPTESQPKSILIPVDVPSIAIVHTANINLRPSPRKKSIADTSNQANSDALTTNELVPATLSLKWTRIWDTDTKHGEMSDMEFSYEVTAPADTWLVGGRRKGHFVIPAPASSSPPSGLSSRPETEADIPLLLIPQREGWLGYPNVDIREVRPVDSAQVGFGANSGGVTPVEVGPEGLHCETDLKNVGESVRVITDRGQVTLSLDASGPGGGPLVLEVEKRSEMGRIVA